MEKVMMEQYLLNQFFWVLLLIMDNVLVFIMTEVRPFNLIKAEFNVWRQAVNYIWYEIDFP